MKEPMDPVPLTDRQREQLLAYQDLLLDLNRTHNLVSDASAADFWRTHIAHSLCIATIGRFPAGGRVVDWGTGGGLPGIPLAILFPEVHFVLVDSVGKKVRAVRVITRRLGLSNVEPWHGRAEDWAGELHYAVSRATAPLATLWSWTAHHLRPIETCGDDSPQGLIVLKGGALDTETADLMNDFPDVHLDVRPIPDLGLADKAIVHVSPGGAAL